MRPIDADTLFDFLAEQLDKETGAYSKGRNVGINIARSALHDKAITPTIAPTPNKPMTLEELRGMDGEPVWVEFIPSPSEECTGLWALVSIDKEYDEIFLLNSIGGSSSYEEAFADIRAIYRHKPEEGIS